MADHSYADDPTISDDAALWRRIHPSWIVEDENRSGVRVSSAAFDDSSDGSPMSVLLEAVVRETDRGVEGILSGFSSHGLASFTAGCARGCNQGVARDPLPDEPAHAFVFGPKSKSNKRCLARRAVLIVQPE